ncbi:hypothetical protein D3C86_992420 [compost metagenome]
MCSEHLPPENRQKLLGLDVLEDDLGRTSRVQPDLSACGLKKCRDTRVMRVAVREQHQDGLRVARGKVGFEQEQ